MTREENNIQKIAITGGTGLIGGAVRDSLREAGHEGVVISIGIPKTKSLIRLLWRVLTR